LGESLPEFYLANDCSDQEKKESTEGAELAEPKSFDLADLGRSGLRPYNNLPSS
jgi:hypothetical protein